MSNNDVYISKFHNKFIVLKTDDDYLIKVIGTNNVAFCVLSKKMIIINKNETFNWKEEHYLSIEAHEICHYIANHTERADIQSEKEADKMAFILLNFFHKPKAAVLIKERFEEFYKIPIKTFKLSFKLKAKLILFLLKKIVRLDRLVRIYNSKK